MRRDGGGAGLTGTYGAGTGYLGMNTPKRPADPPTHGAPLDHDPDGTMPRGIPAGMEDVEAKGRPTSDRQATETATNAIEKP